MPLYNALVQYVPPNSGIYRCPGDDDRVFLKCAAVSPTTRGISYLNFVIDGRYPEGKLMWDYNGDSKNGVLKPSLHRGGVNHLYDDGRVQFSGP